MFSWLTRLLLGRRLASREQAGTKIGVAAGVPALGLDGLASSAYGPEALLAVLAPLGAVGLAYATPLTLVILGLLGVLFLSYRQTIGAYPTGGGAYAVARANLGTTAGLLAAAALMIDYVLTAAVGVAAGVGALVSIFPGLHSHTVWLCLGILGLVAAVNLRGTSEAGWAFGVPTYLFLASFAVIIGVGVARTIAGGGHPRPVVPPPALPAATTSAAGVWLLAHAFASGCTAMTGVEAVSNGVTAFKDPAVPNARRTLAVICGALAVLLGGVAVLARAYGIGAMNQEQPGYQSVLSQLVAAAAGRGWFYYLAMGTVLCVLCLSANTSFVGFPRLCGLVAADRYLPTAFENLGRRLVYTVGIGFLTAAAAALLVAFGGITERLIPLYAVGAFGAFTASQAGMVVHWRRASRQRGAGGGSTKNTKRTKGEDQSSDTDSVCSVRGAGQPPLAASPIKAVRPRAPSKPNPYESAIARTSGDERTPGDGDDPARLSRRGIGVRLAVNAVGAAATGAALVVILVAKFTEGAWVTVLAIPAILLVFRGVRRHYAVAARRTRPLGPIDLADTRPPIVLVPTAGWNALTDKAVRFAMRLSPDVVSVHLADLDGDTSDTAEQHLRHQWATDVEAPARAAGLTPPRLELVDSPYRQFLGPLLAYVDRLAADHPDRLLTVVVPELVKQHWWQFLLHNYRAERLRSALLRRAHPRLVVVSVPWCLDPAGDAAGRPGTDDAERVN